MQKTKIDVPRLNPNDDELLVVDILVSEGDNINKGQHICTYETTKTSVEFVAELDCNIKKIFLKKNEYFKVGSVAFEIVSEQNYKKEVDSSNVTVSSKISKRITLKAEKILKENNINIKEIKTQNDTIKASDVIDYLNKKKIVPSNKKSVIVGSGSHAVLVADLINQENKELFGFVGKTEDKIGQLITKDKKVISSDSKFYIDYKLSEFNLFIGIGGGENNEDRKKVFNFWKEKNASLPALISSRATVSKQSQIGEGTIILPGAVVGPNVVIGKNCIINNNSIVCHDSLIGHNVHLTPGSVVAGNCTVGKDSTIGMCATIFYGINVGENCLVYNNASVLKNLQDNKILNNEGLIQERKK